MSTKRTDWFPAHINPVHRGTYEVRSWVTGRIEQHYWNGTRWLEWVAISDAWRGLANKPKN